MESGSDHSDSDDSLADPNVDSSRVMMSIFASYYGIEATSPATGEESQGKGEEHRYANDIDSVHFNAESFCRALLQNAPLEEMLLRDTKMTHEIRALDSDMQMLVYENYNKFIAATETIKRMKSNVDAMDSDMATVKTKMDQITASSIKLDESLEVKHVKVDKLVRVRRVLERLEFLSELPEKLESMILKEEYQRAVRLYRRTIHVLTQHSQVLSFRKIKERTEAMMTDLRGKVTDLLEDPNLEAVKLTQYASILRLMEANRQQVCSRLLMAHRQRSLRMIRAFTAAAGNANSSFLAASVTATATSTITATEGSPSSRPGGKFDDFTGGSSSDRARRFHQGLVVGLIEACKGLRELYSASPASLVLRKAPQASTAATPRARTGSSDGSFPATPGAGILSLPKEEPISPDEIAQASTQFNALLKEVLASYKLCMLNAFGAFFDRHLKLVEAHQALEAAARSSAAESDSPAAQAVRASQLHLYELEDERQAWVLLARQSVADCQFCDREAADCMRELRGQAPASCSPEYSSAVLFALESHLQQCLRRRVQLFCSCLPQVEDETEALTLSFLPQSRGGNANVNSSGDVKFPGKIQQACKDKIDALAEAAIQALCDFCGDAKEVVDVYGSIDGAGLSSYLSNLASAWGDFLCSSCETLCGVSRVDGALSVSETISGARIDCSAECNPGGLRCLLLHCALGSLASQPMVTRMEKEWATLGGSRTMGLSSLLQSAASRVLQGYIEHHAGRSAALSVEALEEARGLLVPREAAGGSSLSALQASSVSPKFVELVLDWDRLAAVACVVLGDGPTVFPKLDEYTRRSSTHRSHAARGATGAGGANQLQLNIDRLFAQRVTVFAGPPAEVPGRALDALMATVIKAALKAALEATRVRAFSSGLAQLSIDLSFVKKCAGALVPGPTLAAASTTNAVVSTSRQDVDSIHEQLLASLHARTPPGVGGVLRVDEQHSSAIQEAIKNITGLALVL